MLQSVGRIHGLGANRATQGCQTATAVSQRAQCQLVCVCLFLHLLVASVFFVARIAAEFLMQGAWVSTGLCSFVCFVCHFVCFVISFLVFFVVSVSVCCSRVAGNSHRACNARRSGVI